MSTPHTSRCTECLAKNETQKMFDDWEFIDANQTSCTHHKKEESHRIDTPIEGMNEIQDEEWHTVDPIDSVLDILAKPFPTCHTCTFTPPLRVPEQQREIPAEFLSENDVAILKESLESSVNESWTMKLFPILFIMIFSLAFNFVLLPFSGYKPHPNILVCPILPASCREAWPISAALTKGESPADRNETLRNLEKQQFYYNPIPTAVVNPAPILLSDPALYSDAVDADEHDIRLSDDSKEKVVLTRRERATHAGQGKVWEPRKNKAETPARTNAKAGDKTNVKRTVKNSRAE